jgi:hypothetical protein
MIIHLALAALLLAAASEPAHAQVTSRGPATQDKVTPAELTRRLEATARKVQAFAAHADRIAVFDTAWPGDPAEYAAMGRSVIVLVSVVTTDAKELPVQRVYLRVDGKDVALQQIAREPRKVAAGSRIRTVVGVNREDAFYLAPAEPMMREGAMLADFAANRKEFSVVRLPLKPPAFARQDPGPTTAPDRAALKAMLGREYPGFALPADLP